MNAQQTALTYNLFLDDERFPPSDGRAWVIARSYDDAVELVEEMGMPDRISFDHDLGPGNSGYDFAKYVINYCLDHNEKLPVCTVHSMNPVGARNIEMLIHNFIQTQEK